MNKSWFALSFLFCLAVVHAEDGCPPGQIPARSGSPDDLSRCVEAPAPLPHPRGPRWADRWGSIAIDNAKTNVGLGAAAGMASKRQAEKAALQDCRSKGGAGCQVSLSYDNQCAVVVAGIGYSVSQGAASIGEASTLGLKACNDAGVSSCTVYYSACSLPEQVR
jgi:hypothetical protein